MSEELVSISRWSVALLVCILNPLAAQDNLALTGTASQTSDFNPTLGADKGNDGNFGNSTATASADDQATWEVDLGAVAEITQIVVHNRGDGCCQSRLRDIVVSIREISLIDDPFGNEDPLFDSELLNAENVEGGGTTAGPPSLTVDFDPPIDGRYVWVKRLPDPDLSGSGGVGNVDESNVLSVGEVEVFGTITLECPSEGDTICTGIDILEPIDGGPGIYSVSATGDDASGDPILYTFTADNGFVAFVEGPGSANTAEFNLGVDTWTISATVDDDRLCDDTLETATRSETIEVLPPAGDNKALLRPSRQSTDFAPNLGADKGNDGDLTNFTATASADDTPFWEVDLLEDVSITHIEIHNRDDCCPSRLRDITVTILDAASEVVWESDLLNPENELGGSTTDGPDSLPVPVKEIERGPVTGRFVRVSRTPDPDLSGTGGAGNEDESNVLSVGEVEVFDSDCDIIAATCTEILVEGPVDGGPGDYTVTAVGNGDPIFYTFAADNGIDPLIVRGPQEEEVATFSLGPGDWTLSARVGDSTRCGEELASDDCTTEIEVDSLGIGTNIALGGVAIQSTDYNANFPAERAIDGDLGNSTATAFDDSQPFWEVDLGSVVAINTIVLHNRGDGCCPSRLRDISVFLLDDENAVVWESQLLNELNELGGGTTDGPPRLVLDLREDEGGDITARVVRIERLADPDLLGTGGVGDIDEMNILSLGEVEVFSDGGQGQQTIPFFRGDCDADGVRNITDGVSLLNFLFLGGRRPTCLAACDTNGDGGVPATPTDALALFNLLFLGGADLPAPSEACGPSSAPNDLALGCLTNEGCAGN